MVISQKKSSLFQKNAIPPNWVLKNSKIQKKHRHILKKDAHIEKIAKPKGGVGRGRGIYPEVPQDTQNQAIDSPELVDWKCNRTSTDIDETLKSDMIEDMETGTSALVQIHAADKRETR